MERSFVIRAIAPDDRADCGAVYFDAVRNGTAPHYTAEQARAWAPTDDPAEWGDRLYSGTTWVAEADGAVQGFLTFRKDGHLDLFFVRPDWRGASVSAALYDRAIDWADRNGIKRLTTHASLLARRFLESRGWRVVTEERTMRNDVLLKRFAMSLDRTSG